MGKSERAKGLTGEREVAAIFRAQGFAVRGLEAGGDWLALRPPLTLAVESKRCETARPWAWRAQSLRDAPAGAVPIVAFRRNRSEWLALLAAVDLATLLGEPRRLEPLCVYCGQPTTGAEACAHHADLPGAEPL